MQSSTESSDSYGDSRKAAYHFAHNRYWPQATGSILCTVVYFFVRLLSVVYSQMHDYCKVIMISLLMNCNPVVNGGSRATAAGANRAIAGEATDA